MASEMEYPSRAVNTETPIAKVRHPIDTTPPGIELCHDDAISKIGPQKNPKPKSGRIVKKIFPIISDSPGQISPKLSTL